MSSDLVIELADFGGRKKQIEEEHYRKEENVEEEEGDIDSVKELLIPAGRRSSQEISIDVPQNHPHAQVDQSVVDAYISKAQQKRLRRLFDASDKGKKGYLTPDELHKLFKKFDSVMPGSDLVKAANETQAEQVTFNQFLSIFATVKGAHRQSVPSGVQGIPEQIGTYLLKTISKRQAAKKVSRSRSNTNVPKTSSEYDYEEYGENRIILVNARDHRSLGWAKAGAIFRAALIGAFWAAIAGIAEYFIGKRVNYTGDFNFTSADYGRGAIFWGVVIGVNVIATILEIVCLYLDSLEAAASISGLLGMDPWLMGYVNDMDHAASAIVRAAFELPHPSQQIMGIRPLRYSNRMSGFMRAILWKSKRGLTALLLGMVLRRLIPRASMKAYSQVASPFIAVPIAALWNSLVAWKVVQSIYSMVIGNIAVSRIVTQVIEPKWNGLTESAKRLMYCVAGVGIALEQQIHPTLETLLRILCRFWGDPPPGLLIDDKYYLQNQLLQHHREEQLLILQLLALCIVSNSNISVTAMLYLKKVAIACNLNPDDKGLDDLRNQLHNKPFIDVEHITDLFRDSLTTDHSRSVWGKIALALRVISYNLAY
eukprot:Phypoly_transcript_03966.p1 GENE.Phypoly_transcript_03966~~Phypoly_transcript_03966.p1  ORF type:complete len:596 (+),score=68.28 Phypoly_transcript_03966:46-1833(+)